jgi:hypothetical protein
MPPTLEQITNYLSETENSLLSFNLDPMAMRGRLPALRGVIKLLERTAFEAGDEELQGSLSILEVKARKCRDCIERRLLIRN